MRAVTSYIAVLLVAAVLCLGCKRSGDNPDKEGTADSSALASGAHALEKEEWTRAYDYFSEALADNDAELDAYYGRATAALQIAQNHYRLAKAAATNQDAETGESEAAKADESFQNALDDCDKALALDPGFADAYYIKGVVAQYQGAWERGVEAFSECVKLDPDRAEAYQRRGEIYDHVGDYMNASVDFKKASELGYSDGTEPGADANLHDFSDLNYDADEEQESQESAEPTESNE